MEQDILPGKCVILLFRAFLGVALVGKASDCPFWCETFSSGFSLASHWSLLCLFFGSNHPKPVTHPPEQPIARA